MTGITLAVYGKLTNTGMRGEMIKGSEIVNMGGLLVARCETCHAPKVIPELTFGLYFEWRCFSCGFLSIVPVV